MKFGANIIILGLSIALFFSARGCLNRSVRERQIIQAAEQMPDSGRVWRDRYDREHRQVQAMSGDYQLILATNSQLLDSIGRMLKIRRKRIQGVTQIATQLGGKNVLPVRNLHSDSQNNISFSYQDHWMSLSGEGVIRRDSLAEILLNYRLADSLIVTTYTKRRGLFRSSTFVDVMSSNPNMRITSARSILVTGRPKRWGIGLQAGASWNGIKWYPYAGVGLSYNIIRF